MDYGAPQKEPVYWTAQKDDIVQSMTMSIVCPLKIQASLWNQKWDFTSFFTTIFPSVMEMKFSCGISWKLITCNFSIVTMHQWSSLTCLLQMCLGKIFKYFWTYPPFWKHATNGMFNNSFRNSVLQLGKCLLCHTTRSSRVPPINFLGPLFPSYSNLLCIYLPIKIIKRFRLFIVYMKVMKLCMS